MAGVFDQNIIYRVQQANDIVEVIGEHIGLVKKGREMVGLCPFHQDHRPSLYVNPTKQIFKCFACGAGGDVLKFVQMRENLTFPQAIERLADRANVKLPERKKQTNTAGRPSIDPNRLAKINCWVAEYFQGNLHSPKGKSARDYLAGRKITAESIKKWQIGLALPGDDLLKKAGAEKIPVDLLKSAGFITAANRDKFVNRLMFTIADVTGRIIGFGGRTLDGAGAKYINSPTTALFDKSNCLFGLQQARHHIVETATAIVVEGYTDCIMAEQFGCCNVVATLGTSFTSGHAGIIRRYASKIVLLFDGDIAGTEAANRALEVCLSQRIDIKLASVPDGRDPCDFILSAGKEKFEQLIETAVDVFDFKWQRLTEKFKADDTFAGRKAATEQFLQTIATALHAGNISAIEKGLIVNRISKVIGLDAKQINAELAKKLRNAARASAYNADEKPQNIDYGDGLSAAAQREILEVLLNEPAFFKIVKQKVTAKSFDVPILAQIAAVLFEILEKGEFSLAKILATVESVELAGAVTELAHSGGEKGNFRARIIGAVDTLLKNPPGRTTCDIKSVEDQMQFLKNVQQKAEKKNPYNIGMV